VVEAETKVVWRKLSVDRHQRRIAGKSEVGSEQICLPGSARIAWNVSLGVALIEKMGSAVTPNLVI
jgi:hypothetical protein